MVSQQAGPVQQRALVTREKILKAGEHLFSRKGYFRTNSRDIAHKAGVAVGSFYVYFKDKKEVLLETLERHNEEITRRMGAYIEEHKADTAAGKAYVTRLIDAVVDAHRILPDYHKEIVYLMHTDPDIRGMMKKYTDESISITYRTLMKIKNGLKVTDLHTAAEIVTVFIEEIAHRIVFEGKRNDQHRLVGEAAAMVSAYLLKRPS